MSKKIAPTRGEGISTPQIIAANPQSGNTFSVAAFAEALETAVTNEGIQSLGMAIERMAWVADLADAISDAASEKEAEAAVNRMQTFAIIIAHIADEAAKAIGSDLAMLRDEHLPRLLAALPNGGEA